MYGVWSPGRSESRSGADMACVQDTTAPLAPAMSGSRWPIRCAHTFNAAEMMRLREGVFPREEQDRWALGLEADLLRCWRTDSNACIYEARLIPAEDGGALASVVDVLDDETLYQRASTDEGELERFEGVLSFLRRREVETTAAGPVSLSNEA